MPDGCVMGRSEELASNRFNFCSKSLLQHRAERLVYPPAVTTVSTDRIVRHRAKCLKNACAARQFIAKPVKRVLAFRPQTRPFPLLQPTVLR